MAKDYIAYRLKGKDRLAASLLEKAVNDYNGDIQKTLDNVRGLAPNILYRLGALIKHLTVRNQESKFPRAYHTHTVLHTTHDKEDPEYILFSPVDIKGKHFKPEEAELIDQEKDIISGDFGDLFYKGRILTQSPVFNIRDNGTILLDYDRPYLKKNENDHTDNKLIKKIFMAHGRSLDIVKDHLKYNKGSLKKYWQLANPTAPVIEGKRTYETPELNTINGIHYLVYTIDKDREDDHCLPPDAIPVNPEEFEWKLQDKLDRIRDIKPPQPPEELAYLQPVKTKPPQLKQ